MLKKERDRASDKEREIDEHPDWEDNRATFVGPDVGQKRGTPMRLESRSAATKHTSSRLQAMRMVQEWYSFALASIVLGLCCLLPPSAPAQTFTVLHAFTGRPDGASPHAGLLLDKSGNLYGTTAVGGDIKSGWGTVFKVTSEGQETVLYSFASGTDGANPQAGLIMDASGNLYGTTSKGGSVPNFGTVFKVSAKGKENVLFRFNDTDGSGPVGSLVRDAKGNLYGTTQVGAKGYGTVFKLDSKGNETVLHSFARGADGAFPLAGLIMDAKGNLYGTTESGGTPEVGTVFEVDNTGEETILYSFKRAPDGYGPYGGLVMDAIGNFYGTAEDGGKDSAFGTVFKLTKSGVETVLHSFASNPDGANPWAGLIRDAKGNLYGTTSFGGIGKGTVFEVSSEGEETVLYTFTGGKDGGFPHGGLVMDGEGNLYGTTTEGGDLSCDDGIGCGTVFKLTP
jgi:uncharacterized repeat protein (TIGR03803 family)